MTEGAENKTCIEPGCGQQFVIEERERAYFERNGLQQPKRCKDCRARRKAARPPEQQAA